MSGSGNQSQGLGAFVAPRPHSCRRTLPSVSSAHSWPYNPVSNSRGSTPAWFLEVERAAYLAHWREKVAKWSTWAAQHALGQPPAVFVTAGYLRDSPDRFQRSIVPLLREIPEALRPLIHVLDLAVWDRASGAPQLRPLAEVLP